MNERLRDCHVLVGVKDDSLNNMLGAEQHPGHYRAWSGESPMVSPW